MNPWIVSVDLGQARDFTAISVLERTTKTEPGKRDPLTWQPVQQAYLDVVHIERMPLGTSYPQVVERVKDIVETLALKSYSYAGRVRLVVDATGVGRPVMDLLKDANLPANLTGVTITAGERETFSGEYVGVPKRILASRLVVAFQRNEVRIARSLSLGDLLVKELLNFRVRVTTKGNDVYEGDWREGQHDDLVLSLALGVWLDKRPRTGFRSELIA